MSHHDLPAVAEGSISSYLSGFTLSLILTFAAFFMAYAQITSGWSLLLALTGLALAQFIVQMLFFLHVWHDAPPHWNSIAFVFMLIVVAILVGGTLWIMHQLDYNLMS